MKRDVGDEPDQGGAVGRFAGKNVIVTGDSSGIGWAITHAFVDEGATVFAVARRGALLDAMRDASSEPARVHTAVVDVGVPEQARGMVAAAIAALGRVHVLVNNAAVMPYGPVLEMEEGTWRETLAVNLDGPFFASQAAARHMVEEGGGVIVNIASANAFRVESPATNYNTSKAALVMMTRCFAHELGHLGLRACCVAPGQTVTPEAVEELSPEEYHREFVEYCSRVPLRRPGRPDEQAAAVLFLASDDASFINGETIIVDGGELTGEWYDSALNPPVPGQ
ncbi:MAG: SDR family oxidoreductase [Actinomycetota bacterium]|nr:MAG: SDR family oxidoreductase [Actinomycetota bacterium]